ncbi:hypothetical protein Tco_0679053 [Tanacetum coccineum]|uniref:Uncharacterized protein n=1 Tax=Tanacetum coccineum TaxID=301880 RepID=A0ABQ4XGT2_9ASTR
MQLRKQIDEMIKAGKLSQFIKELKQNDKPKALKKGEASGKDKPLTILMIQPWERVAKPRITQSFSSETAMSFPPLKEEDGAESPMIIEVEMGGTSRPDSLASEKKEMKYTPTPHDELHGYQITNPTQCNYRQAGMKENLPQ